MIDVTVVIVWSLHYNYPYIGVCMYKLNIKSHVSKEWFNFQATIKFKNPDRLKILVKIYMSTKMSDGQTLALIYSKKE